MRALPPTVALILLVVAPGCGDGTGSSTSTTAEPTTTTVLQTTTPPPSPATRQVTAPTTTPTTTPPAPLQGLQLEVVGTGFARPTYVAAPPGDPRLFVVERRGTVVIVDDDGEVLPDPFLDIRDAVLDGGIEQGLLGLAFHPQFEQNGRFFVYYTDEAGDSRLVEYTVPAGSGAADPGSARQLLHVPQPTDRHNAGMLLFGPDGYLYVSLGEGGAAADHAQDPNTLLSAILRLDVDSGDPYGIPPDNPFVEGGGAPEVWAYGLRNPWRFAFDEGLMYIADVGHSDWEEINVVPLGGAPYNFGWLIMEGTHCFSRPGCDTAGLVLPVLEYGHDEGCSVTGGFVYRGVAIPELVGHYFYADWCGSWVRSFRYANGRATQPADWSEDLAEVGQVNSFGLDGSGEMYVATWSGMVARIAPVR